MKFECSFGTSKSQIYLKVMITNKEVKKATWFKQKVARKSLPEPRNQLTGG